MMKGSGVSATNSLMCKAKSKIMWKGTKFSNADKRFVQFVQRRWTAKVTWLVWTGTLTIVWVYLMRNPSSLLALKSLRVVRNRKSRKQHWISFIKKKIEFKMDSPLNHVLQTEGDQPEFNRINRIEGDPFDFGSHTSSSLEDGRVTKVYF
jgi:hypothetical protein